MCPARLFRSAASKGILLGAALALLAGPVPAQDDAGHEALAKAEQRARALTERLQEALQERAALLDRCAVLQRDLAIAKQENARQAAELAKALEALAALMPPKAPRAQPPEAVRGKVVNVDNEASRVTVSVGERHGVAKGLTLVLFRDDQFVGEAVVEEARAEDSVARFVREAMKLAPQVGDGVRAKRTIAF